MCGKSDFPGHSGIVRVFFPDMSAGCMIRVSDIPGHSGSVFPGQENRMDKFWLWNFPDIED